MARRHKTLNYYKYLARVEDMQGAQDYCDALPDHLEAAVVTGTEGDFVGIVLPSEEQDILLQTDFSQHPQARVGETRLSALTAAHQAYLGAVTLGQK